MFENEFKVKFYFIFFVNLYFGVKLFWNVFCISGENDYFKYL